MEEKRIPKTKSGWPSLNRIMEANGETDESLAEKLGMSDRTILAYRRGDIQPPVEKITALAEALGCSELELRQDGPVPPVFFP